MAEADQLGNARSLFSLNAGDLPGDQDKKVKSKAGTRGILAAKLSRINDCIHCFQLYLV